MYQSDKSRHYITVGAVTLARIQVYTALYQENALNLVTDIRIWRAKDS